MYKLQSATKKGEQFQHLRSAKTLYDVHTFMNSVQLEGDPSRLPVLAFSTLKLSKQVKQTKLNEENKSTYSKILQARHPDSLDREWKSTLAVLPELKPVTRSTQHIDTNVSLTESMNKAHLEVLFRNRHFVDCELISFFFFFFSLSLLSCPYRVST